jgi:RimJ/RimL family protein N-acetyltransferase
MSRNIDTPRLQLLPSTPADVDALHALCADRSVRRYLFDDREITREEARSFIEASIANFEQHGYGLWIGREAGTESVAAFVGFLRSGEGLPDLVYSVRPDRWGLGYATEAAGAVLQYALQEVGVEKIVASVDDPNAASIRVLENIGMTFMERRLRRGRPLLFYEVRVAEPKRRSARS